MQNKNKLIIIAIVLVIIGLVIRQDEAVKNEVLTKQLTEVNDNFEKKAIQDFKSKEKSKFKSKNQIVKPLKADKANAFAEDPIVNIAIYSAKFSACTSMKYFEGQKKNTENLIYWTEKHQEYFERIKPKCHENSERYSEFTTYIDSEKMALKKQAEPKSIMSEYLDFNKKSFSKVEALDYLVSIGQNYPDLIPNSILRTHEYNMLKVIPDLKDLLQTSNKSYVYKIENYAINFMACRLGANCNELSTLMYTYCLSEDNFCVKDFMELYNTRLSAGVKADIQLALAYFKKLYKVE